MSIVARGFGLGLAGTIIVTSGFGLGVQVDGPVGGANAGVDYSTIAPPPFRPPTTTAQQAADLTALRARRLELERGLADATQDRASTAALAVYKRELASTRAAVDAIRFARASSLAAVAEDAPPAVDVGPSEAELQREKNRRLAIILATVYYYT